MLDYLKRFLIAGIVALCVSLLFFGGKPQAQMLEKTNWIWPTNGIISDTFGTRFGHHKGIDIAAGINTPIVSVDNGKVTKSYYSDTYGHVVFIKHNNNLEAVYAHLNQRLVHKGQHVTKGEMIGRMGNTGKSSGVHLHFEVHENEWTFEKENALNPSLLLGKIIVGKNVQALGEEEVQYVVKNVNMDDFQSKDARSTEYIVKPGESLWSIADKYSTTIEILQRMNSLENTKIFDNQKLKVPILQKNTYVVQNGDTLSDISIKTNISVEVIKKYNQLHSDTIFPLQIIKLPNIH